MVWTKGTAAIPHEFVNVQVLVKEYPAQFGVLAPSSGVAKSPHPEIGNKLPGALISGSSHAKVGGLVFPTITGTPPLTMISIVSDEEHPGTAVWYPPETASSNRLIEIVLDSPGHKTMLENSIVTPSSNWRPYMPKGYKFDEGAVFVDPAIVQSFS